MRYGGLFEHAHVQTATKRERFLIFSSNIVGGKAPCSADSKSRASRKQHDDAGRAKTQLLLHLVFLQAATSVKVHDELFVLSNKSYCELETLHSGWRKTSAKQRVFPKNIKSQGQRVSFRMIPSLEMSLMVLWTENWALVCEREAMFVYIAAMLASPFLLLRSSKCQK